MAEEITAVLVINLDHSLCGNDGANVDPTAEAHTEAYGRSGYFGVRAEPCGARFTAVGSEYNIRPSLRPDLEFVGVGEFRNGKFVVTEPA